MAAKVLLHARVEPDLKKAVNRSAKARNITASAYANYLLKSGQIMAEALDYIANEAKGPLPWDRKEAVLKRVAILDKARAALDASKTFP